MYVHVFCNSPPLVGIVVFRRIFFSFFAASAVCRPVCCGLLCECVATLPVSRTAELYGTKEADVVLQVRVCFFYRTHRSLGYGCEPLTDATEVSGTGNTRVNTPDTVLYVPYRTQSCQRSMKIVKLNIGDSKVGMPNLVSGKSAGTRREGEGKPLSLCLRLYYYFIARKVAAGKPSHEFGWRVAVCQVLMGKKANQTTTRAILLKTPTWKCEESAATPASLLFRLVDVECRNFNAFTTGNPFWKQNYLKFV